MMNANRSERAGNADDRYDFDRLERSVDFLIDEHRRLSAERDALLGELLDREHRIATLESRLATERATRTTAVERVGKVLSRLEQLQGSAPFVTGTTR